MNELVTLAVLFFVVAGLALWNERGNTAAQNAYFVVVVGVLSAIGGFVVTTVGG